ncbi:MAG TPA: hypothetical protein VMM82_08360, partial [Spirochaetia bacterium]|nr:hypothetical protein [Spirochaetia bacterium]
MKRRNGRRVCLGFQWDAGSWDDAPLWCEYLFTRLEKQKVHWNLPAFPSDAPLRKRASFARSLRDRIQQSGDVITSMGFSGACHPVLNLDELDKELSWGLKNPWGTGLTDVLNLRTHILIPRVADFIRPGARELYADRGFSLIGVCDVPTRGPGACGDGFFPAVRLRVAESSPADPDFRSVRRLISSGEDVFILLDLAGLTKTGPLERATEELIRPLLGSAGFAFSLVDDSSPARPPAPKVSPLRADWSPFPASVLRARLKATAGLARRKRKKTEEYQDLLSTMARVDLPAGQTDAEQEQSPNRMRLVAHMLGDVALAGRDFDVKLSGGRFCGITRQGSWLLPSRPALSYLRVQGRTTQFRTLSSFSFEGENGTGLREELGIEGENGASLSIEYSFRDDSPLLSVKAEISYPPLPAARIVEEYAPLAITLAELPKGGTVTVHATAPDESAAAVTLAEKSGWVLLPGAVHRIARADGGSILLQFSPRDGKRWGIPFFRVVKTRGG